MEEDSFVLVIRGNPTPTSASLIVYIKSDQVLKGEIQKGPFPVIGAIARSPMELMKKINSQIPKQRTHLPLPDVLFSATHVRHLRPPASKKNV
jgi:hypothetical protein